LIEDDRGCIAELSIFAGKMFMAIVGVALVLFGIYRQIKDTVLFGKIRFVLYEGPRMLFFIKNLQKNSGKKWSYVNVFEQKVDKNPDLIQFISVDEDKAVTLGGMERLANQIAHWGISLKLTQHDSVSLMMLNKPELAIFWIGMAKIGVSTALINSNITGKGFIHSAELPIKDMKTKVLVVDSELKATLSSEIAALQQNGVHVFFWDELDRSLSSLPTSRPSPSLRNDISEKDTLIYIFTSGTTGLPKACKLSSTKFSQGCCLVGVLAPLRPGDRFYNVLPLYHSAGGMIALGGCLEAGATMVIRYALQIAFIDIHVVILESPLPHHLFFSYIVNSFASRKKFSVRSFTPDVIKYKCHGFQYIGELCRYLANAPNNPEDAKVSLRFAIGNGMRPDIWVKFQKRYNVKRVIEFYGATEGNVGSFNSTGKVGALGYMPSFLSGVKSIK
jgi:fatty-acyl-CoA synthase